MKPQVIYMMPGLGASPDIFKGIEIPKTFIVKHLLWIMPEENETLEHYVQRLVSLQIDSSDKNPILLGMSFGGILINEISKEIPVKALIFISTVKSFKEFPPKNTLGKWLQIYRWFPFRIFENPQKLKTFMPAKRWKKRMDLYDRYLDIRNPYYFNWSVEKLLKWKGDLPDLPFIHIHGDKDKIFPVKYILPPVEIIEGATHMGIFTHHKQISRKIASFLESLPL